MKYNYLFELDEEQNIRTIKLFVHWSFLNNQNFNEKYLENFMNDISKIYPINDISTNGLAEILRYKKKNDPFKKLYPNDKYNTYAVFSFDLN